jgi:general secretion pathway protein I
VIFELGLPTFAWRAGGPRTDRGPVTLRLKAEGKKQKSKTAAAFTLLEVLVALAIFALAAVVLGATYVNALNAYEMAARYNEYTEDLRFLRAALLTEPERDKVAAGGELDLGDDKRARWQADIVPTATVDLFSVTWTCEITDPARRAPYRATQTLLLLRPTWSDPVERSKLLELAKQRILQIQGKAP